MRNMTLFALLTATTAAGQMPLPYSTGFDNTAQQSGWQEFRTGHQSNYSWSMNTLDPPSAPNRLWHDYPVSGDPNDTVRDWWVSPPLDLSAGAFFTCKVNVFAIMGSAMPEDACGIMLLTGSADPELATVTPLADLLPLVTNSNSYTQLPLITIPPTAGPAYIAFLYQATQNWLTPGIDDVSITASNVGIAGERSAVAEVHVFPNPGAGPFTMELRDVRYAGRELRLVVQDTRGALVLDRAFRDRTMIDLPLAEGNYGYELRTMEGTVLAHGWLHRSR